MQTQFSPGISYLIKRPNSISELLQLTTAVDLTYLQTAEISVKEIRPILRQLIERPYGVHRLLYIPQADQLSTIIQTTLLKTIEEPPEHLIIVLQTNRPESLLHTVRSRLQPIREIISTTEIGVESTVSELEGADRAKAIAVLQNLEKSAINETSISVEKLNVISSAIQRLLLNCNVKLTIDWFLLRWSALSGTE